MLKRKIGLFAAFIAASAGVAIAQAEPPAPTAATVPAPVATGWKSSAAAGLTLTRGNSDTTLATLRATTTKKWEQNELTLTADGAYGLSKVDGKTSQTADSIHGFVQYNRLFNERLYGYLRAEGLHDEIAAVRYRFTLAPGAGYYFIKEKKMDLCGEVGPGYVYERLGNANDSFVTLRFADKFHRELSDRARVWQTAEWLPQADKLDNYVINAETGIEADLTADKKLSLRALLQDSYSSQPASGREKNDAKIVTAIAYKF